MNRLKLVRPTKEYEDQVMAYKEAFEKNQDSFDGCAGLEEVEDYEEACRNAERDYIRQYEPEKVFEKAQKEFDLLWDKMKRVAETLTPLILVEDKREKRFNK